MKTDLIKAALASFEAGETPGRGEGMAYAMAVAERLPCPPETPHYRGASWVALEVRPGVMIALARQVTANTPGDRHGVGEATAWGARYVSPVTGKVLAYCLISGSHDDLCRQPRELKAMHAAGTLDHHGGFVPAVALENPPHDSGA